jgi:hypothetical protein
MTGRKRKTSKGKAKPARPGKPTKLVAVRDPAAPRSRRIKVRLPSNATAKDRREAEQVIAALDENAQLSREPGPLPPGATHRLEDDGSGVPRLVRKRFSAR